MDLCDVDIYDDLDEFAEKEEKKAKEYAEIEKQLNEAMRQIEFLNAEKKNLQKKIKIMEINFQSLLDTAKTEIKRKDKVIQDLNKEKDDICFRRKRPKNEDNKPENYSNDSYKNFQEQTSKSDHQRDFGQYKRKHGQDDHILYEKMDSSHSSRKNHNKSNVSQVDYRRNFEKEKSNCPNYGNEIRKSSDTITHSKLSGAKKKCEKKGHPNILPNGQQYQIREPTRDSNHNTNRQFNDQQNYNISNDHRNVCEGERKLERNLNESKIDSSQIISKNLENKQAGKLSSSNKCNNGNDLKIESKKSAMTNSKFCFNANQIPNLEQNILSGEKWTKNENNFNKTEGKSTTYTDATSAKSCRTSCFGSISKNKYSNHLNEKILDSIDHKTNCLVNNNADCFEEKGNASFLPSNINLNAMLEVENMEVTKANDQFRSSEIKNLQCKENANECKNSDKELSEVDDLPHNSYINNNINIKSHDKAHFEENKNNKTDNEIFCSNFPPSPIGQICATAETSTKEPDEIDKRLRTMFQSPPNSTSSSPMPHNNILTTTPHDHLIEETDAEISVGHRNLLNATDEDKISTSCSKSISLGSSDYRFEKISENTVKLYVKRKKISKNRENI